MNCNKPNIFSGVCNVSLLVPVCEQHASHWVNMFLPSSFGNQQFLMAVCWKESIIQYVGNMIMQGLCALKVYKQCVWSLKLWMTQVGRELEKKSIPLLVFNRKRNSISWWKVSNESWSMKNVGSYENGPKVLNFWLNYNFICNINMVCSLETFMFGLELFIFTRRSYLH